MVFRTKEELTFTIFLVVSSFVKPAVLEIIPHEDMLLFHGQPVCVMELYKMMRIPEFMYGDKGNHYLLQMGPQLSKHFV